VYFIWQHDWALFVEMAPFMFKLPGLLKYSHVPFPNPYIILGLQIIGTGASLSAVFFERKRAISSLLVFVVLFFLDFNSNGFGFVNVQIHFIWFSLVLSIVFIFQKFAWVKSYSFRVIELIIVLAYVQSFLAKMLTSGLSWGLDGTVLQIGILRQALPYGRSIANYHFLSQFISMLTLLFEASFIFYFFLSSKYKKLLLGIAILFHISTFITLGIGFFHLWVMNLCIILFAYKETENEYSHITAIA
jgi:hypothetical protein